MKTKIIIFFFALLGVTLIHAQQISNSSFENWSNTTYFEEPPPYFTTNMNSYMMLGVGNVTKSLDHNGGQFSARLETILLGTDTMFGGMFLGIPGPGGITGGAAMAVHPDSLSIHAKYNLQLNDTAYVMVLFKHDGFMSGMGAFAFAGNQNTFSYYSTAVTWYDTLVTDTVAVIITSSALDPPQFPGSVLFVDDLNFIGDTATFPNGDFETWTDTGSEDPDSWATMNFMCFLGNPSVIKTTDSHDGTYAAQVTSVQLLSGDTMGFLTNGYLGDNGPQGGMHVSQNPEKVTGYYKYMPVGNDTAIVGCFVYIPSGDSSVVADSSMLMLEPTINYTYFEVPFTYDAWPIADTLNISFTSGNLMNPDAYIGLGSTLFIDMLDVQYYPVTIPETFTDADRILLYPNPSPGNVAISFYSTEPEYSFDIYDSKGSHTYHKLLKPVNGFFFYSFDMSCYEKGVFQVKLSSTENSYVKKVIIN